MDITTSNKNYLSSIQLSKLGNTIKHAFFTKNVQLDEISNYFRESKLISHIKQVHGNEIHIVDKLISTNNQVEADAQITILSNVALVVRTADCGCLLLVDPITKMIASIHAGWRGVAEDIIKKVVDKMEELGTNKKNIYACLGPTIQQKSYEVGPEVKQKFLALDKNYAIHFINKPNNKSLFNLPGLIIHKLQKSGIKNIEDLRLDTYTNENFFNSYRRSCHKNLEVKNNVQFSVIMLI